MTPHLSVVMVNGKILSSELDAVFCGESLNNLLQIFMIGLWQTDISIVFARFMNSIVVSSTNHPVTKVWIHRRVACIFVWSLFHATSYLTTLALYRIVVNAQGRMWMECHSKVPMKNYYGVLWGYWKTKESVKYFKETHLQRTVSNSFEMLLPIILFWIARVQYLS